MKFASPMNGIYATAKAGATLGGVMEKRPE
jgi:hypothetical protein